MKESKDVSCKLLFFAFCLFFSKRTINEHTIQTWRSAEPSPSRNIQHTHSLTHLFKLIVSIMKFKFSKRYEANKTLKFNNALRFQIMKRCKANEA